jgi:hypothetical protein
LTGYLCSNRAMQASPWVRGASECALDAFLSGDASCGGGGEVVRLCSSELAASAIPWGRRVSLSGAYEEAELCMISRKGEDARCEPTQHFVPSSLQALP